jgi:predicted dehydrogenase
MVWEGISWSRAQASKSQIGIELRGEDGSLFLDDNGYTIYDREQKVVEKDTGSRGDDEHLRNFLDAVRDGSHPNADVEEGHKSTMLCHLGNIAYRTGQSLEIDPSNGHIVDNPAADAMWAREYRKGWLPNA